MARIAGIELQDNWRLEYALTKIKGIGWSLSKEILASLKINPSKRVGDLKSTEVAKIISKFGEYPIEGELLGQVRGNISRLKNIGSYRGMRHTRGLPSRGQRTKTNARTKRGKRKTVGAFKKEALVRTQSQKAQKEE
jgi:small subunit ribosomal protein S13